MLTFPLIVPRDSHELWFGSSRSHGTSHQNQTHNARRSTNGHTLNRPQYPPTSTGESLSALHLEERALRARKNNIAYFGYSWIKPAGCSKTMLGMREEEAEREEAFAAAQQEIAAAAAAAAAAEAAGPEEQGEEGEEGFSGMERDLDDDIPDGDVEGLVEEGEEGLEEEDFGDEEGYMERDLDDDVPETYPDEEYDLENGLGGEEFEDNEGQYEDFDNQVDLDDEIPSADGAGEDHDDDYDDELNDENEYTYNQGEGQIMSDQGMARDLDDEIPSAVEDASIQGEEWQHTDSEAEFDDDEESFFNPRNSLRNSLRISSLRNSTSSAHGHGLPQPPSIQRLRGRETEAQRRFLQRWSGGGDSFVADSSMMVDEEDLRASVTSRGSRRSVFGRFSRRTGGPRDSLDG
ncbi:uncharacterized protein ASPGLDRAFT_21553 [Aspergillus glaucus CBS 516.65]|uniref:Apc15p protein n=1 Tax=Aspergillus glaucus CBS 516.65 TaxID=1160497 RepID=A0A1L9VZU5_ASPGL|nr:hypothetical protein ASPGLDRAFT_21553 [Aspergillus glaucus CBS 516.65]OJJ89444.1 hypothetical protein ASPGLDRAFT_21553 [Aspergillus glaucus CBS 516.65]